MSGIFTGAGIPDPKVTSPPKETDEEVRMSRTRQRLAALHRRGRAESIHAGDALGGGGSEAAGGKKLLGA